MPIIDIIKLIASLTSEDDKDKLIDKYNFQDNKYVYIIYQTYCDTSKEKILTEKNELTKDSKLLILASFELHSLINFINNHKEGFFKDIKIYEIIMRLPIEKQVEFIDSIAEINLTENEKMEILATIETEAKLQVDNSKLTDKQKKAIKMKTTISGEKVSLILDLDRDLNDYEGLDNLIRVNPTRLNEIEIKRFLELCDICPGLTVENTIIFNNNEKNQKIYTSSAMEYKQAEEWMEDVISTLKPDYRVAQIIAVIDNAIGRKISYSPDFDTEVFNDNDSGAFFRIISSGYGTCNGIAGIVFYMLHRVVQCINNKITIECEFVVSQAQNKQNIHAFLKLKNVEFELYDGKIVTKTTIVDPTWNMTAHRFGGKPNFFCISYKEARNGDVGENGIDYECHKNDEKLKDATFSLDDKSLRKLFTSVHLANPEGIFPLEELINQSEKTHQLYANQPLKDIKEQFVLLSKYYPEFANCQNSTMKVLEDDLLNNELLKYSKCVVNRVYNRVDKSKRPVLFVYFKFNEIGEIFYYADKAQGAFIELPKEQFLKQFEAYKIDIESNNGIRPWEEKATEQKTIEANSTKNLNRIIESKEERR